MPLDKTRVAELEAAIDDEQLSKVRTQPLPAQRRSRAVRPRRRAVRGAARRSRGRPARLPRGSGMPQLQGLLLPPLP